MLQTTHEVTFAAAIALHELKRCCDAAAHDEVHAWPQKHCTPTPAHYRLCFRHSPDSDQSLKASATAAATRIVNRSANLTAVDMVDARVKTSILSLSDLLTAGAASGLATHLRKLTGVAIKAACVAQQLQALWQCTSLTHLDINGRHLWGYLGQHSQQAAEELTAALRGLHLLI